VGRHADRAALLRFGVSAMVAVFAGAALMARLATSTPLHEYGIGPVHAGITTLKIVIATLLALLATLELWPTYQSRSFSKRALSLGGMLPRFVGGVSGMQGALRAPFFLRTGLTRGQYVGTANVISTPVDATRLLAYVACFTRLIRRQDYTVLTQSRTLVLVAASCAAGFLGSHFGLRAFKKIWLRGVRLLVAVLLLVLSALLAAGSM
jgi:uncharacterized protein